VYDFQPLNKLLCFVVERSSGSLVWSSDRRRWWTVEAARARFGAPSGRCV